MPLGSNASGNAVASGQHTDREWPAEYDALRCGSRIGALGEFEAMLRSSHFVKVEEVGK